MATLLCRNKADIIQASKPVLVPGYVAPMFRQYADIPVKRRWDIIEVRPDLRSFGRMEGHWSRDLNRTRDFLFYRVHVPCLSVLLKGHIERSVTQYATPRGIGEFQDDQQFTDFFPRSYYLDFDSLSLAAKTSLAIEGECTLAPGDAYQAIRSRVTGLPDRELFEAFSE